MAEQHEAKLPQRARGTQSVSMYSGPSAFSGHMPQVNSEAWHVDPQEALAVPPMCEVGLSDGATASGEESDNTLRMEEIHVTNSFRDWQCIYLRREAQKIHRLVCSQLQHHTEEALFMLFLRYDYDLDGEVRGTEVVQLLETLGLAGVSEEERARLQQAHGKDGPIPFVALLEWYNYSASGTRRDTNTFFNIHSLSVGLLGSGMLGCDERLEKLGRTRLRRNILG